MIQQRSHAIKSNIGRNLYIGNYDFLPEEIRNAIPHRDNEENLSLNDRFETLLLHTNQDIRISIQSKRMIETINLMLLKKFEGTDLPDGSGEFINRWLTYGQNYQRLQRECDKIWLHQFDDDRYDAERAFKVLGQRLLGICRQESC